MSPHNKWRADQSFFNEGTGMQRVPGMIVAIPVPATYEVKCG